MLGLTVLSQSMFFKCHLQLPCTMLKFFLEYNSKGFLNVWHDSTLSELFCCKKNLAQIVYMPCLYSMYCLVPMTFLSGPSVGLVNGWRNIKMQPFQQILQFPNKDQCVLAQNVCSFQWRQSLTILYQYRLIMSCFMSYQEYFCIKWDEHFWHLAWTGSLAFTRSTGNQTSLSFTLKFLSGLFQGNRFMKWEIWSFSTIGKDQCSMSIFVWAQQS